jgi:hypothetical protein
MLRTTRHACCWIAFLGILGCQGLTGKRGQPDDPLFVCKHPIAGKPSQEPGILLANNEPQPPPFPTQALVRAAPGVMPSPRKQPLVALPVSRQKTPPIYGCAENFSWIQGIYEPPELRGPALRYHPQPADDPSQGRILLEKDPRLDQFRIGDVLRIDGGIASDAIHYHVEKVMLIRRVN